MKIKPFLAQRLDLNSDILSMILMVNQSSWVLGTNGLISSVGLNFVKDTAAAYPPGKFGFDLSWFVNKPVNELSNKNKEAHPFLWD